MQLSTLTTGTALLILITAGPTNDRSGQGDGGTDQNQVKSKKKKKKIQSASEVTDTNEPNEVHELEQIAVSPCLSICQSVAVAPEREFSQTEELQLLLSVVLHVWNKPHCPIDHDDDSLTEDLDPVVSCQSLADRRNIDDSEVTDCCERCVDQQNHSSELDIDCGHAYSKLIRCMEIPGNKAFVQLISTDPYSLLDPESTDLPCYKERLPYIKGRCGKE